MCLHWIGIVTAANIYDFESVLSGTLDCSSTLALGFMLHTPCYTCCGIVSVRVQEMIADTGHAAMVLAGAAAAGAPAAVLRLITFHSLKVESAML